MADQASKIREEIVNGRAELAETVQALVEKADVKGRMRDALTENADHLQQKAAKTASHLADTGRSAAKSATKSGSSTYAAAGGIGVLLFVLLVVLMRARGRR
ncbi:MAG TPA: DUF3618 domain-containing protein [Acidimicrobiales bacterium]|nr:DUF3618 domain-containing protein [Acidimicrobiales bacterium]